jgi:hypothetical protein
MWNALFVDHPEIFMDLAPAIALTSTEYCVAAIV